jgi:hypothetical protein
MYCGIVGDQLIVKITWVAILSIVMYSNRRRMAARHRNCAIVGASYRALPNALEYPLHGALFTAIAPVIGKLAK